MRKLSHSELLKIRKKESDINEFERHPVSIILSNVRSLYNVGSMFRTCDSAFVSELILTGFTPYPPRKEIEKTALGAVDTVPWKYFPAIQDAIEYQRNKGFHIAALEITNNSMCYDEIEPNNFPLCIIAGNELTGIDNAVLELCDFSIEIPMYGVKHSLNVSIATGIAIYSSIRQWHIYNNT
ncbi:MAG: RNA methyltransferase [Ignavibacteriae bacterium HGW-Ignavibacteriae-1]|jgi:tRNA G18 (ribose-2'-O)-methylase SpoU|nr:MAG: RNA methyltransferase [Ignavibacteriae bacterium HGW-Ignavibacteriae-1]